MTVVPRCMSTQHPDNVAAPPFAGDALVGGDDEIREAHHAFAELGCDEQMWDYEGKEVDAFVVEKLLTAHEAFFREHPIGETLFLTPRVPNPALEPSQAKLLLEVLQSLPRHADAARLATGRERPPIFEVIFPMTTSGEELDRIVSLYAQYVAGIGRGPLGAWLGAFAPEEIRVIPLIEDRPYLLAADAILRDHLRGRPGGVQRVFIARSDPALNYGMTAAVLLSLIALDRLGALEAELGRRLYPIIGVGGAPFRGNLRPDTVLRCLERYPSVETFTVQSAFKYDHPLADVREAIATLRAAPRRPPLALAGDAQALDIADRTSARYRQEVAALAPAVNAIAEAVPRRRRRRLHIGLFGYSRGGGGVRLPRAIPFCAALYSAGLPPELLGLPALGPADWDWLGARVPGLPADLRDAIRYFDPAALTLLPGELRAGVAAVAERIGGERDQDHRECAVAVRRRLADGDVAEAGDVVLAAAGIRRFLG